MSDFGLNMLGVVHLIQASHCVVSSSYTGRHVHARNGDKSVDVSNTNLTVKSTSDLAYCTKKGNKIPDRDSVKTRGAWRPRLLGFSAI